MGHCAASDRHCHMLPLIAGMSVLGILLTPDEAPHHSFEAGASSFQERSPPLPAEAAGSFDEHT